MKNFHESKLYRIDRQDMYICYIEDTYELVSRNVLIVKGIKDVPCVEEIIDITSIEEDWKVTAFGFLWTCFGGSVGRV